MTELWIPVAEELGLPEKLEPSALSKLLGAFDPGRSGSAWNLAEEKLGLMRPSGSGSLLRYEGGRLEMRWDRWVEALSHGTLIAESASKLRKRLRPLGLFALLRAQWRAEGFLVDRLAAELPSEVEARIQESVALGIVAIALTLRLPGHSETELGAWLADPARAPFSARRTIVHLEAIQRRRTRLSPAWAQWLGIFGAALERADGAVGAVPVGAGGAAGQGAQRSFWRGTPASGGRAQGRARRADGGGSGGGVPGEILVFAKARPETVERFGQALAVVFGEGSPLSHACTVARERNLPAVTGVGREFVAALDDKLRRNGAELLVDGGAGTVEFIGSLTAGPGA